MIFNEIERRIKYKDEKSNFLNKQKYILVPYNRIVQFLCLFILYKDM